MTAPVAPWALSGEAMLGLVRRRSGPRALPDGLSPLPGPVVVVAARYDRTPVGPYLELAVAEPARLGPRPGWCVTTMAVSAPDARAGGQLNWGYPKELALLTWTTEDGVSVLRWAERGIEVRGTRTGIKLPVLVPLRMLQRRKDGPVVVPAGLLAAARHTRLSITVPDDDPLASLARDRLAGVYLTSLRLRVRPARHPMAWALSFRAPLRAPSPALFAAAGCAAPRAEAAPEPRAIFAAPGRLAQR